MDVHKDSVDIAVAEAGRAAPHFVGTVSAQMSTMTWRFLCKFEAVASNLRRWPRSNRMDAPRRGSEPCEGSIIKHAQDSCERRSTLLRSIINVSRGPFGSHRSCRNPTLDVAHCFPGRLPTFHNRRLLPTASRKRGFILNSVGRRSSQLLPHTSI